MVGQTDIDEIGVLVPSGNVLPPQYKALREAVEKKAPFEPVFINEYDPSEARKRYEYIKGRGTSISKEEVRVYQRKRYEYIKGRGTSISKEEVRVYQRKRYEYIKGRGTSISKEEVRVYQRKRYEYIKGRGTSISKEEVRVYQRKRYEYIKGLLVPFKCVKYTYTGSKNHLHFIWRVHSDYTETETMNESLKVRDHLKKNHFLCTIQGL